MTSQGAAVPKTVDKPASDNARWWTLGVLVLGLAGLAFAYRDLFTLGSSYDVKSGVEYWLFVPSDRAPLIVLGLSAWLAYRRWPRLRRLPLRRGPITLVAGAFLCGWITYFWSIRVRAEDLQAISLMFNVAGFVMFRWGLPGLRVIWLPIAFLAFCIPVPAPLLVSVLWELRLFMAEYTGWLLYLLGIPAFVSGDQILRASESFQVIEGCSGMRSAETLTMLVVLLIDLFGRRGFHAVLLLASAPPVALALNGVRVLTLTLNPHSEVVGIHSLQGIAILLVGLLLIYAFDGLLARVLRPVARKREPGQRNRRVLGSALPALVLAVALAAIALAVWNPVWSEPRPARTLVALVDQVLAGKEFDEVESLPSFLGRTFFREHVHRSYRHRGSSVELFVGSADLRDRRTSIVSWISALPGSGWGSKGWAPIRLEPGGHPGHELVVEKGNQRRLVYHLLVGVDGLWTEAVRSFLGLDRSDFRRRTGQLAIRLSTRMDVGRPDGREQAEQRLQRLYEVLIAALVEDSRRPDAN